MTCSVILWGIMQRVTLVMFSVLFLIGKIGDFFISGVVLHGDNRYMSISFVLLCFSFVDIVRNLSFVGAQLHAGFTIYSLRLIIEAKITRWSKFHIYFKRKYGIEKLYCPQILVFAFLDMHR